MSITGILFGPTPASQPASAPASQPQSSPPPTSSEEPAASDPPPPTASQPAAPEPAPAPAPSPTTTRSPSAPQEDASSNVKISAMPDATRELSVRIKAGLAIGRYNATVPETVLFTPETVALSRAMIMRQASLAMVAQANQTRQGALSLLEF